jgi:hypothetical protein
MHPSYKYEYLAMLYRYNNVCPQSLRHISAHSWWKISTLHCENWATDRHERVHAVEEATLLELGTVLCLAAPELLAILFFLGFREISAMHILALTP